MSLIVGRRYLELEIERIEESTVHFIIKEQTHRTDLFSPKDVVRNYTESSDIRYKYINIEKGAAFISNNTGWMLASVQRPELVKDKQILFCRGNSELYDRAWLEVDTNTFDEIKQTVDEYNNLYSGNDITDGGIVYFKSKRKNILNDKYNKTFKGSLYTELSDFGY